MEVLCMSRLLSRAFFIVLCCLGLALVTTSQTGAARVGKIVPSRGMAGPIPVGPFPRDWPSFGSDLNNTRFNRSEVSLNSGNVATLVSAWSAHTGNAISSSPVMANGIVYIVSVPLLYAFNATTGATLWSTSAGIAYFGGSSLTVANGTVYLSVSKPMGLAAFNATTGAQLWSFATVGHVITSPVVANGVIYFGSTASNFYAVDATTGAQLWQIPIATLLTRVNRLHTGREGSRAKDAQGAAGAGEVGDVTTTRARTVGARPRVRARL